MDDSVFLLRGFLHVSPRNFQEVFPVRAVRQNYRVSSLAIPQRTERVCPCPRCPLLPAHTCSSWCFRRHVHGTRRVLGSPRTCVTLAEQRPAWLGKQMSQPSAAWGLGWYPVPGPSPGPAAPCYPGCTSVNREPSAQRCHPAAARGVN